MRVESAEKLADCPADGLSFVTAEIVHNDDVAGPERWNQLFLDINKKALAIDGTIKWGTNAIVTQSSLSTAEQKQASVAA